MTIRECPRCGNVAMRVQKHKHEENVGGIRVHDETGMAWVCDSCGEWEIGLDDMVAYERRAAAVVLRDLSEVPGAAFKYARKALGMRQADLAELLGIAGETLSRYENGSARVPRITALAVAELLSEAIHGATPEALLARARSNMAAPSELRVRAVG